MSLSSKFTKCNTRKELMILVISEWCARKSQKPPMGFYSSFANLLDNKVWRESSSDQNYPSLAEWMCGLHCPTTPPPKVSISTTEEFTTNCSMEPPPPIPISGIWNWNIYFIIPNTNDDTLAHARAHAHARKYIFHIPRTMIMWT